MLKLTCLNCKTGKIIYRFLRIKVKILNIYPSKKLLGRSIYFKNKFGKKNIKILLL